MRYLINYDLHAPEQNYEELIKAIKKYDHVKICRSCWAVETTKTAVQIRDELKQCIDSNDVLFVCGLGTWASRNLKEAADWLNK